MAPVKKYQRQATPPWWLYLYFNRHRLTTRYASRPSTGVQVLARDDAEAHQAIEELLRMSRYDPMQYEPLEIYREDTVGYEACWRYDRATLDALAGKG